MKKLIFTLLGLILTILVFSQTTIKRKKDSYMFDKTIYTRDVLPFAGNNFNLGIDGRRFDSLHVKAIEAENIYSDTVFANTFKENYLVASEDIVLYVSNLGSDITGDGSESTPYSTINKALLEYKDLNTKYLFVHADTGTYVIDDQTVDIINNYFLNATIVRIRGSQVYDTLEKNLTLTAIAGDDKFQYATTGTSWTNGLYNKKFVRSVSTSKLYPISGTKLDTLEFVDWNVSGTYDIIELKTKLVNQRGRALDLRLKFNFAIWYCDVDLTVGDDEYHYNNFYDQQMQFFYCNLTAGTPTGKEYLSSNTGCVFSMNTCNITARGIRSLNGSLGMTFRTVYVNGDASVAGGTTATLRDMVLDAGEFQVSNDGHAAMDILGTDALKIKNNNEAFRMLTGTFLQNGKKIVIENIAEFVEMENTFNTNFYIEDVIGEPTSVWYDWDVADPGYRYNPERGYNVGIKGYDYREMDSPASTTLANNSTTEITIGDKTQNRSLSVEYTAYRNGKIEQGTVQIFHDGTLLFINRSSHDNQSGNGIGLLINSKFDGTNTDLINIELIVDDNIDAVIFDYSLTRKLL